MAIPIICSTCEGHGTIYREDGCGNSENIDCPKCDGSGEEPLSQSEAEEYRRDMVADSRRDREKGGDY